LSSNPSTAKREREREREGLSFCKALGRGEKRGYWEQCIDPGSRLRRDERVVNQET
jgi:hypothetical protein